MDGDANGATTPNPCSAQVMCPAKMVDVVLVLVLVLVDLEVEEEVEDDVYVVV